MFQVYNNDSLPVQIEFSLHYDPYTWTDINVNTKIQRNLDMQTTIVYRI
jgi:hypothetical protein